MTLRTMTETQTLDRTTVAKTEASAQSLMPEGILDALTPDQIRDLFGFLMRKEAVAAEHRLLRSGRLLPLFV